MFGLFTQRNELQLSASALLVDMLEVVSDPW
jgi:hypothetical protein